MVNFNNIKDDVLQLIIRKAKGAKNLNLDLLLFSNEDVNFLKYPSDTIYTQLQDLQVEGFITNLHPFNPDTEDENIYDPDREQEAFADVLWIAKINFAKIHKYKQAPNKHVLEVIKNRPLTEYLPDFENLTGKVHIDGIQPISFSGPQSPRVLNSLYQKRGNDWFSYKNIGLIIKPNQLEKAVKNINEQIEKKSKGKYIGIIQIKPRTDTSNRRSPNEYRWELH